MNLEKAHWQTDEDHISLSMNFAKVDKANRIVSGYASVDNVDLQGDYLPTDVALKAFETFRGNVREMHDKVAVGKVVSFSEKPVYDAKTDKAYTGIYVEAFISKGAQSTWEKILDGTLTGFSIGGNVIESNPVFDKAAGQMVRVLKDIQLFELSVVDSPANPLANFTSIVKLADGTATGIGVGVETENAFWCSRDEFYTLSKSNEASCPKCETGMENIGWIESGGDTTEKFRSVVGQHVAKINGDVNPGTQLRKDEGGVDVSGDVTETPVDETTTEPVEKAADVEEVEGEEEVVKAADAEEAPAEEDETTSTDAVLKAIGDLKDEFTKALEAVREEVNTSVQSTLDEFSKSWTATNLTLENRVQEVSLAFAAFQKDNSEMAKVLGDVVSETATKKSGDLGGSAETTIKKSNGIWGGTFVGIDALVD